MNVFLNFSALITSSLMMISATPENRVAATYKPVVVLELFTSQGCSSCPAADRLLNEITAEATTKKQRVYGLSFHVDYWDRLGWKDPYSNRQFSDRQRQYARRFAASGVYMPQEVVNGRSELVGSNRRQLQTLLTESLRQPATVAVSLSLSTQKPENLTLSYSLKGSFDKAVLNVVLVSKSTVTTVERGENAGRKLVHNNVVRTLQTIPATESGQLTVSIPADFDRANGAIITYVQSRQGLAVTRAGQRDL